MGFDAGSVIHRRYADCVPWRKGRVRSAGNAAAQSGAYFPAMSAAKLYLREWRRARGLSQDDLAARVDTSKGYISQIERGERPWSQKWLDRFAEALGADPEQLLAGPPRTTPGISDRARRFGDTVDEDDGGDADIDLMRDCVETAFRLIAGRRNLVTASDVERAARDAAEAAVSQYLTYKRLQGDDAA